MPRQRTLNEFRVSRARPQQTTPSGNLYVVCDTDKGLVAFWGSPDNTANIAAISAASKQSGNFLVGCRTIRPDNPAFPDHDFWVPENEHLVFPP